jgi:hypothetical protein
MLAVVRKLLPTKGDDVAALQEEIAALKRQGAQACAEIEEIEQQRALAPSYETALAGEARVKELRWNVAHVDAMLPGLEARLAQAMADRRQAALARHRAIGAQVYGQLRSALVEASRAQAFALRAREDAIKEVGEALVQMHLPAVAFMGLLTPELLQLYFDQMDRVFAPRPKPKAAAVPAPVRAALPAPAKPKAPVAVAKEPAPRPARVVRHDPFPDGQGQALVVFLRAGVEIGDGTVATIGDQVSLPAEQARTLAQRGVVDYVTAPASAEKING